MSDQVSEYLHPTEHIIGHSEEESFQPITCTATDNEKQQQKQNQLNKN